MGEQDPEPIIIPVRLWAGFDWLGFAWKFIQYAKTFTRKCSVKKIVLFGILLDNNEDDKDMNLSGIKCEYTVVKEVK